ncbi:MAG: Gfo/Idh/MocA family oxidoreductase [Gallionella sp.]|nr:Gfo/Idh/MocA family oxidoreductase [Gallionella sp.]
MIRYKTALIGFGRIAAGYADDPSTARCYSYATHAQVLRDHPAFDWLAVVDPSAEARAAASSRWGVPVTVPSLDELPNAAAIEVVVIATPPEARAGLLDRLPSLRAVLVEKPLGVDLAAATAFVEECNKRGIAGAVNFPRRYDPELMLLANGGLVESIGRPQVVFGTYGNGLRNNGSHLIDLVSMLLGPVVDAHPVLEGRCFAEGPIAGDSNFPFNIILQNDLVAAIQPLAFSAYREVSLDIWGERGRMQFLHESLTLLNTPVADNRQLAGARELLYEASTQRSSGLGRALYLAYDNLAAVLRGDANLLCPLENGLSTMRIVENLMMHGKKRVT